MKQVVTYYFHKSISLWLDWLSQDSTRVLGFLMRRGTLEYERLLYELYWLILKGTGLNKGIGVGQWALPPVTFVCPHTLG